MRRTVAAALASILLAASARADVIPSRRADPDASAARQTVATRLEAFGLSAPDAAARASQLLDEEARYFAAAPERVQFAGREGDDSGVPYGEKMILGFLGLVVAAGAGAYVLWGHKR